VNGVGSIVPLPDTGVYCALPTKERCVSASPRTEEEDQMMELKKFEKVRPKVNLNPGASTFLQSICWSAPYPEGIANLLLKKGWDVDQCSILTVTDRQAQLYNVLCKACVGTGEIVNSFEITRKHQGNIPQGMRRRGKKLWFDITAIEEGHKPKTKCRLQLGLGLFEISFEDEPVMVLHQCLSRPNKDGVPRCIVLFIRGTGRGKFFSKMCEYLYNVESETFDRVVNVYRYLARDMYWANSGSKYARNIDSVVLPKKIKDMIIADMERFLSPDTHKFYFKHGIPYKRSYLFRGKPGAGKTSMVEALAGRFKRNICQLQPAVPEMTDASFATCLQTVPKDSLIVLEDIDALFSQDREQQQKSCPLTFSALLNGLDGISSPTAQIFVMTTNHPERLDPALVRSGRVDMHIEFKYANEEQIRQMFENFYPGEQEWAKKFGKAVLKTCRNGVSMAALQQHFVRHMCATAEETVKDVPTLKRHIDLELKSSSDAITSSLYN